MGRGRGQNRRPLPVFQKEDRVRTRVQVRAVDHRDRLVTVAEPGAVGTVVHVQDSPPLVHVWFDGEGVPEDYPSGVHPKDLETVRGD